MCNARFNTSHAWKCSRLILGPVTCGLDSSRMHYLITTHCSASRMDLLLFTLLSLSLVLRSAGGSSLCSFDLNYDLCVEHLSVPGSRGCDKLTSQLEVQFGATSIHFKTQGVRWSGQELEELEASVEQNGAEFKYSVVNENISGILLLFM